MTHPVTTPEPFTDPSPPYGMNGRLVPVDEHHEPAPRWIVQTNDPVFLKLRTLYTGTSFEDATYIAAQHQQRTGEDVFITTTGEAS